MTAVISLAKPAPATTAQASVRPYVQRAELVLGLPDYKALASLGLSPDPLQQLAAAMASVRTEDGEKAEVAFDLVPVSERRLARRRRRLMARAARRGPSAYGERLTGGLGGGGFWGSAAAAWSGGASASNRSERIPRQTDLRDGVGKLEPGAAVFAVQILLRTEAAHPQLALARMHQLIAALSMTSGRTISRSIGPAAGRSAGSSAGSRAGSSPRAAGSG